VPGSGTAGAEISTALLMTIGIAVGEMLGQKKDVHLVRPDHVADDQIVGPVIAVLARVPRGPARLDEDLFMGVEQSRDLRGTDSRPFGGRAIELASATSC